MKSLLIFGLSLLAFNAPAFASDHFILLKSSGGGMVHPDFARSQTCKLYREAAEESYTMVVEEKFGGVVTKERIELSISGLEETISKSAEEPLSEKPNYLCDAPTTTYLAIDGYKGKVPLFQSGGCGSPRVKRNGISSGHLRSFLDAYCPITHDHGIK